jgi:DNA-binding NarL/FixJ family response regulator
MLAGRPRGAPTIPDFWPLSRHHIRPPECFISCQSMEMKVALLRTPPPLYVELTPRERDVVRGVVAGRTNGELARELGLKEQSVKNLLSTVYLKCHVRNRLELALFAVRHHMVHDSARAGKSHGRGRS